MTLRLCFFYIEIIRLCSSVRLNNRMNAANNFNNELLVKVNGIPFDGDPWRQQQTLRAQSNPLCCIHNRPHVQYCYFDGNPWCSCHKEAEATADPFQINRITTTCLLRNCFDLRGRTLLSIVVNHMQLITDIQISKQKSTLNARLQICIIVCFFRSKKKATWIIAHRLLSTCTWCQRSGFFDNRFCCYKNGLSFVFPHLTLESVAMNWFYFICIDFDTFATTSVINLKPHK